MNMRNLRDAFAIHVAIIALCVVFKLMRRIDQRFRKATRSFSATYLFRAGSSSRRLVFGGDKIKSLNGECAQPDFEIRIVDLPGAFSYMAKHPDDPITLIMENKIEQTGNLYFLYKFGYLCGLCETFFSGRNQKHVSNEA